MILYNRQADLVTSVNATTMVSIISKEFLGSIGGVLAIIGVIVLPITSGDTAFRSVRLIVAEAFNIDQRQAKNRVMTTLVIFIPAIAIVSYVVGAIVAVLVAVVVYRHGLKNKAAIVKLEPAPIYNK